MNNNDLNNTNAIPEIGEEKPAVDSSMLVSDPTAVSETPTTSEAPAAPIAPTVPTSEPVSAEQNTSSAPVTNRMEAPGVIGNIGPNKEDPNAMVNEDLNKVEINYTPPSKGKVVALILFFLFLIAFIIFLPQITTMVDMYKAGQIEQANEKIVDGRLICTYDTNTTDLDKGYRLVFSFTGNKLEKLDYMVTTKGNPTLDASTMDDLAERCKKLKETTGGINGINVSCDYSEGKLIEKQGFTYAEIDAEQLDSAYSEAGGTYPQYTNGQDMDSIETGMNASGYTCKRERN